MIVDRFTSAKISSNLDERTLATLAILATDERRVILNTAKVWGMGTGSALWGRYALGYEV